MKRCCARILLLESAINRRNLVILINSQRKSCCVLASIDSTNRKKNSEEEIRALTSHLIGYRNAWRDYPSFSSESFYIRKSSPAAFHRKSLSTALFSLERKSHPAELSFDAKHLQVTKLARLAISESLGEAISRAKALLYSGNEEKTDTPQPEVVLEILSATLCALASAYVGQASFKPIEHDKDAITYRRRRSLHEFSHGRGYFKRLLDVNTQFLFDSMKNQSLTLLCWVNHFALLQMGAVDEHLHPSTFDMWLNSFHKWYKEFVKEKKGGVEHSRSSPDLYFYDTNEELNGIAFFMVKWFENHQRVCEVKDIKRLARIWALLNKIFADFNQAIYPKYNFRLNIGLFGTILVALKGNKSTGNLLSHVVHAMRTNVAFHSLLCAPWNLLSKVIVTIPVQKALALCVLRCRIENHCPLEKIEKQSHFPYHLDHCTLNLLSRNQYIAESEHVFRMNNSPLFPAKKITKFLGFQLKQSFTLQQARKHLAESRDTQREYMVLLMLGLYSDLPIPDLQSALDILRTYVLENEYTQEHFRLLIRAASNDPDAAYALYIEACSRGMVFDKGTYDVLFYALGKGTRWLTQSTLAVFADKPSALDSFLSVPSLSPPNSY